MQSIRPLALNITNSLRPLIIMAAIFGNCTLAEAAKSGCLYLKEDARAQRLEDKVIVPFSQGRILPFEKYDAAKEKYLILYRGQEYWLPSKNVKFGPSNLCSVEPKCFKSGKVSLVYDEQSNEGRKIAKVITGQRLPWMGRFTSDGTVWYQVEVGDQFGWIEAEAGALEDRACPNTENAKKTKWHVGFELGYETNLKSSNYNSALSAVTTPADVEYTLPDPFYTELKPGSGFNINFILGIDFRERWNFQGGVGYSTYTYDLVTYANPSNFPDASGIPFASLSASNTKITEQYIQFPAGAYYKFLQRGKWNFETGPRLDLLYPLSKPFSYTNLSGTLFKQQRSGTYTVGPDGIQSKISLEIRALYHWNRDWDVGMLYRYSQFESHSLSMAVEY